MATDPDGDSQMASSPESHHTLSDVEDSQPGSRTPTRLSEATRPHFAGASELSPPGSQPQDTSARGDFGSIIPNSESGTADVSQQPGASWMNKRAEEEFQRAMEYVVDQDFNLDEFGDPFDERDLKEKLF
ncbi:hypothetical protein BJY01DRAFT_22629 [Aspergillus pseudoustus]|uniref:Uncharacterized protein n=1 Tax=Aspergillus pseudoustus TaxID=1810923 RepID=A0ABR4JK53_9EURO